MPPEWLGDVRQANEDSLLALADRLPGEAAEALLELATGGKPRVAAYARTALDVVRKGVSPVRQALSITPTRSDVSG